MLTSESFYGQTETSIHRCGANPTNESFSLENVGKAAGETLSQAKSDKVSVNDSSPPKVTRFDNYGFTLQKNRFDLQLAVENNLLKSNSKMTVFCKFGNSNDIIIK